MLNLGFFSKLLEDALRVKVVPKDNEYNGVDITKDKDDLANKQIAASGRGSIIDTEAIGKFRTLSTDRQERYTEFENLLKDATIAAAVEMYADDATQYDYRTGKIIWAESDDSDIAKAANRLIDVLGINDKAWTHIYSLCTYGDVYLRLYRKGDESDYNEMYRTQKSGQTAVRVKPQDKSRPIEEYIEYVDDPASMYDIQVRDKTAGFIKMVNSDPQDKSSSYYNAFVSQTLDLSDVNVYDRTSFVHICLSGNIERNPELIALTDPKTGATNVYKVKTGKSILADAYEPTQTLKLLEDSMMLSRVTKSALVRILQIEVGNMPKPEVESLLRRIKNMIEQKMALNKENGVVSSYNSPGPIENIVYVPTKDGKGAITSNNLGGDVNIKDIVDIDYFNDKKLSALKIPKQYLNYDAPEGLGNGTSLTKLSSRYAHTVMRIQNAYISGITSLLNILFMDKGLEYTGKFTIKMVSPSTLEDIERDEQTQTRIQHANDIVQMLEDKIEPNGVEKVIEWLFTEYLNLSDISDIIKKYKVVEDAPADDADTDIDIDMSGDSFSPQRQTEFDGGEFDTFPDVEPSAEFEEPPSADLTPEEV